MSEDETRKPVLVVDDDRELASMVRRYLEHHGWVVEVAHDGVEALAACVRARPCFVLADLMMPHMDGEELVTALREQMGSDMPPVCLVSASPLRNEIARRLGLPATLEKPFVLDDVRDLAARFASMHRDRTSSMH